jgi:hypothetical protein
MMAPVGLRELKALLAVIPTSLYTLLTSCVVSI